METKPAILILALAAILCGRASGAWNTYSNLVYATRPGFAANLTSLDIYTPTNAAQTGVPLKRVMIYVHGGGWYGGDKAGYILGVKPDAFTSRDWILVSINYRVTPQAVFPAHAEDVAAAFAWVHKNIASYGGDPDQIHVSGWSAGGHLAALVATDPRYLAANGLDLTMIRSVVNIDAAVYDLTTFAQTYGGTLPSIYGDTFGQDPAFWAFASPATYVSAGNLVNNLAPQLCFYSAGQDVASPNADNQKRARTFSKQLSLLGVMSEVDGDLTKTHDAINTSFGTPGDYVTDVAFKFLDRVSVFTRMRFTKSLPVGTNDANGVYMGGTEMRVLTAHKGQLFAGIGYWSDTTPQLAQVLVKPSASAPWRSDNRFLANGSVATMASVTFTTDRFGNALNPPVNMLLASPAYNIATIATVWSRDDTTGVWSRMQLASGITNTSEAYARWIGTHKDSVTGIDHVFAGVATCALYRGSYDPTVTGRIRWEAVPELTGTERIHSGCEANGKLYVTMGTDGNPANSDGGLFLRNDGPTPSWTMVYEWPDVPGAPGLRGLTAVPDPAGGTNQVLIGGLEASGKIIRINPAKNHAATDEFLFKQYFTNAWGSTGDGASIAAYNDMLPVTDPRTGRNALLFGLWVTHPSYTNGSPYNGAYYLLRFQDGTYTWGACNDLAGQLAAPGLLRSIRSWAKSPFSEEPDSYYCGGFDGYGGPWHETAWLYKGTLPARLMGTTALSIAVNGTAQYRLTLDAMSGRNVTLESSPDLNTWTPLQTNLLTSPTKWWDVTVPGGTNKAFWRARVQP